MNLEKINTMKFEEPEVAEEALEKLDGEELNSGAIYVEGRQKTEQEAELKHNYEQMINDFVNRYHSVNLYVNNLEEIIDDARLYKEFSPFGSITSAKVMTKEGRSRGYGFVCFSSPEEASKAIAEMNGRIIVSKPLYVALAQCKDRNELRNRFDPMGTERLKQYQEANLYVNYLEDAIDDERLLREFSPFGTIISAKVMTDKNNKGRSKGYGFVCFSSPEEASKAIAEMNGRVIVSKPLYVAFALRKDVNELTHRFQLMDVRGLRQYQESNLYVKNLEDIIDDERLHREFSSFGTIISSKVMMENGHSKGFGFVCFSSPEEAWNAVTEMNGRIIVSKPLYVALARRKEHGNAHLAARYIQRLAGMRMQQVGAEFQPGGASYFVPTLQQSHRYYTPAQMLQVGVRPRWPVARPQMHPVGQDNTRVSFAAMDTFADPYYDDEDDNDEEEEDGDDDYDDDNDEDDDEGVVAHPLVAKTQAIQSVLGTQTLTAQQSTKLKGVGGAPVPVSTSHSGVPTATMSPAFSQPVSTPQLSVQQAQQPTVDIQGHEVLTASLLTSAEEKQMLGERLFPLVQKMHPELAGKITGMLLENDNSELLHVLDHQESLKAKVDEVVKVLMAHSAEQAMASKSIKIE